ncbi:hypothetical protein ACIP2X_22260 [Streptomyces sp. NPDC089424]|uniref:hypothetical protein n=1 Tax=Streptomyces sp. NPDC089424 TaxID=3365917 RepID=UPI0037F90192
MSQSEVQAGIAAGMRAGGFSEPRYVALENDDPFDACMIDGGTSTDTDPSPKDIALLSGELKRQGWVQEDYWAEEGMTLLYMRRGAWTVTFMGGTLTKEEVAERLPEDERAAAQKIKGLRVAAVDRACQNRVYKSLYP